MNERIETVSKLQAAKRQFRTAVRLYFQRADMISVHTLAAAVHGVILPIVQKLNPKAAENSIFNPENPIIIPERREDWKKIVRDPQNFFKHADRDPDPSGTIDFRPDVTQFHLFDDATLFDAISKEVFPEVIVFQVWFYSQFPKFLHPELTQMHEAISRLRLGADPGDFKLILEVLDMPDIVSLLSQRPSAGGAR